MKTMTRIYLMLIILAGMGLLVTASIVQADYMLQIVGGVVILGVFGVVAESQSVAIDDNKAISIAVAVNIGALLLYGLEAAAWVAFFTAFFSIMDYGRGYKEHVLNTPLYKSLFNASNYILSILAAGGAYKLLGGAFLYQNATTDLNRSIMFVAQHAPAIVLSLVTYVLVNTLILALYFLCESENIKTVFRDWLGIFRWSLLSMFAIGSIGVLLMLVFHSFGVIVVFLMFAPFMLLRYVYVGFSTIKKGYLDTINAFTSALEAKDEYTNGHSQRVSKYCEWISQEMKLSQEKIRSLRYASLLHDVGKIGVPELILNKKAMLTEEEYREVQKHPVIGAQMLDNIAFLKKEVRMIRAHHIFFDGSGYPHNALADSKMIETQILCVADSFDAMTSDRAYRSAMPLEEAIEELYRYSGSQFSPDVVDALVRSVRKRQQQGTLESF